MTTAQQINAQNQALFVTLCMQRGASKVEATQALTALVIPADFDNDRFRAVMLKQERIGG